MKRFIIILVSILSMTSSFKIDNDSNSKGSVTISDSIQIKTNFINYNGITSFNLEILNLGSLPIFIDTLDLRYEILNQNNDKIVTFDQRVNDYHGSPIRIVPLRSNQIFLKSFPLNQNIDYYSLGIKYFSVICKAYAPIYEKYKKGVSEIKVERSFFNLDSKDFFTSNWVKK